MTKAFKDKINAVIKDQGLCMFENRDGKVFLLWQHYVHLDWRNKSKRVFVAKGEIPKGTGYSSDGKFIYLTNPI